MNDKNPTIVIINGANWIGTKLVDTLIKSNGNVIVVDDFDEKTTPFIKHFSDNKRFAFIERDKLSSIRKNFTKIKYFIHLKTDFNTKDDDISSRQFIQETKFVDEVLTIALEKNSAYILVSSIHLHKDFILRKNFTRTNKSAYTESDLQDYIERTVLEYQHKAGLNARISRVGNVYGPEMDLSKDPLLLQIVTDAFYKDEIRVYGDGLEYMYYVFITDAIQGILRALFTQGTSGQIYSITNPEEISVLSVVNKILTLDPKAKRIKFLKGNPNSNPLYERAYIPDPNLSEIGWNPTMSFERGLAQLYDYFREYIYRNGSLDENDKSGGDLGQKKDHLEFDFDNTINLADTFYSPNQIEESEQFRDFYKKLNSEDSPIYNLKNKKEKYELHPYLQSGEEKKKITFAQAGMVLWIVLLFVFLIIPFGRVAIVYYSFSTKTKDLAFQVKDSKYDKNIPEEDLSKNFEDSLVSIDWAARLTGQEKVKQSYSELLEGIEQSIEISNVIDSKNLGSVIESNETPTESNVTEIRNLRAKVDDTIEILNEQKDLVLTPDVRTSVNQILNWLQKIKLQMEKKIG